MDRSMGRGFFALVVVLMAVTLPGMAFAAATCAGWAALVPDGRIERVTTSTTDDLQCGTRVTAGRSYCIEANQLQWYNGVSIPFINYNASCPDTSTADFVSRMSAEPQGVNTGAFRRYCGIASSSGSLGFRLANSSAVGNLVDLNFTETTLYNPRWSTYNGFLSSWGFQNTTSFDINGVLTLDDGTSTYTKTLVLPAGKLTYVFSNDAALGLGADKAGSAMFAHDGPPGGVKGDCYYAKSGVMIPSSFEPARENRH